MEEVARAIGELLAPGGDLNGLLNLNGQFDNLTETVKKSPPPVLLTIEDVNQDPYFAFTVFIVAEVVLGFVGFYLAGAAQNEAKHNKNIKNWEWNEATVVAAAGGGVDAAFIPFAFYYSVEAIGFEPTVFLAITGAYLGAAANERTWIVEKWDLRSPATLNGALEGLQNMVWLVDAITYIRMFTMKAGLKGASENIFITVTYLTGACISYYYIAEDFGDYNFWEWSDADVLSPNFIYGIVRGYQAGTRLPIGFAEIGIDYIEAKMKTLKAKNDREAVEMFTEHFVVKKKWKILGALWLGWLTASVENESFKPDKWDTSKFGTVEAFANGLVFGKDLDMIMRDVRMFLLRDKKRDSEKHPDKFLTRNKIPLLQGFVLHQDLVTG